MLYIYGLTVHLTLQSVKAMTTHIKWLGMSCPSGNGIELEAVGLQFEPYALVV